MVSAAAPEERLIATAHRRTLHHCEEHIMLDAFKSFLQRSSSPHKQHRPTGISREELQIATCALLLEIANADENFTEEEEKRIAALMQKHFSMPEETFLRIRQVAESRRRESIDLWQFTTIIKERYPTAEKQKVVEMLWSVIYADGTLDRHEDHLVHTLATLLGLDHKQLIDAKVNVLRSAQ